MKQAIQQTLAGLPTFKHVLVAVSGGADSVALAHALRELGYRITIAHLNHGLRGEDSDADAAFVGRLAKDWGVKFISERAEVSREGNLENNCRKARYAFLRRAQKRVGAEVIAVGHHRDDQLETVLMHWLRGAGLRGLRGMEVVSGSIVRPLLTVPKSEILRYANDHKLAYRHDRTNDDTQFKRNEIRHKVIPKLLATDPGFETKVLRMSEQARKQWEKVDEKLDEWLCEHFAAGHFPRAEYLKLPPAVQAELLFKLAGYRDIYRVNVEQVRRLIAEGRNGKQAGLGKWWFGLEYDRVTVRRKRVEIRRVDLKGKKIGLRSRWGKWSIENRSGRDLWVRGWRPGDRFTPNGMSGSKKLQDFFTDKKIPKSERHELPLIVDRTDRILAVGNLRLAKEGVNLKEYLRIDQH